MFTQRVLDLRRKYATIVADAFNGDRLFLQAVNHAFEVRRPPLHVAVGFSDHELSTSGRCTAVAVSAVHWCHVFFSWIVLHSLAWVLAHMGVPWCIPCVRTVGLYSGFCSSAQWWGCHCGQHSHSRMRRCTLSAALFCCQSAAEMPHP